MTNTVAPTGPRPEPQVRDFSLAKLSPRARERVLRGLRNYNAKYAVDGRVVINGVEYETSYPLNTITAGKGRR